MKGKLRQFLIKLFSLVLVIVLAIPSQIFAAGSSRNKKSTYDSSTSIMGIASGVSTEQVVTDTIDQTSEKEELTSDISIDETDQYIIEKKATIDRNKGEISYRIEIRDKNPTAQDPTVNQTYLTTAFAVNSNAAHRDIKVDDVMHIDENGEEYRVAKGVSRPNFIENAKHIQTVGIKTVKPQYAVVYYLTSRLDVEAKDDIYSDDFVFAMDMVINDHDGYPIYEDRYALKVNKEKTDEISLDDAGNIIDNKDQADLIELTEKEKTHLINGVYLEEMNTLISYVPATIKWSDYIFPESNSNFRYYFELDDKQDTTDTQVRLEFYEAREDGFVINNSYTQSLPYTEYLDIAIPAGQFARVVFTTTVEKDPTIKTYRFNNKKIQNLAYDIDLVGQADGQENHNEEIEEEDPLPATESGIVLNSYGLIADLKDMGKYDDNAAYFIKNTITSLENYNDGITSYDQLVNALAISVGVYKVENAVLEETLHDLLAGLSGDKYEKLAALDNKKLSADVEKIASTPTSETQELDEEETDKASAEVTTNTAEEFKSVSGIELNKDSLFAKLEERGKKDTNTVYFIKASIKSLENYNVDLINENQLVDILAINAGLYKVDQETIQTVIEGLTDGLSEDKYKKLHEIKPQDLANKVYLAATTPTGQTPATQTLEEEVEVEEGADLEKAEEADTESENQTELTEENKEETEQKDPYKDIEKTIALFTDGQIIEKDFYNTLQTIAKEHNLDRNEFKEKVSPLLKELGSNLDYEVLEIMVFDMEVEEGAELSDIDQLVKDKLAEEDLTLEAFQNFMYELDEKYGLSNEEVDRIYSDNSEAIEALIEKHRDENLDSLVLADVTSNYANKKFHLVTEMNVKAFPNWQIPAGWYFDVNLGPYLKMSDGQRPKPLTDATGKEIATGAYDARAHRIRYTFPNSVKFSKNLPIDEKLSFDVENIIRDFGNDVSEVPINISIKPKNFVLQKMPTINVPANSNGEVGSLIPQNSGSSQDAFRKSYPYDINYFTHQYYNPSTGKVNWDIEIAAKEIKLDHLNYGNAALSLYVPKNQGLSNYEVTLKNKPIDFQGGAGLKLREPNGASETYQTINTWNNNISDELQIAARSFTKEGLPDVLYVHVEADITDNEPINTWYDLGMRLTPDNNYISDLLAEFNGEWEKLLAAVPWLLPFKSGDEIAKRFENGFNVIDTRLPANINGIGSRDIVREVYADKSRSVIGRFDNPTDKNSDAITWVITETVRLQDDQDSLASDIFDASFDNVKSNPSQLQVEVLEPNTDGSYQQIHNTTYNTGKEAATSFRSWANDYNKDGLIPGTIINYTYKVNANDVNSDSKISIDFNNRFDDGVGNYGGNQSASLGRKSDKQIAEEDQYKVIWMTREKDKIKNVYRYDKDQKLVLDAAKENEQIGGMMIASNGDIAFCVNAGIFGPMQQEVAQNVTNGKQTNINDQYYASLITNQVKDSEALFNDIRKLFYVVENYNFENKIYTRANAPHLADEYSINELKNDVTQLLIYRINDKHSVSYKNNKTEEESYLADEFRSSQQDPQKQVLLAEADKIWQSMNNLKLTNEELEQIVQIDGYRTKVLKPSGNTKKGVQNVITARIVNPVSFSKIGPDNKPLKGIEFRILNADGTQANYVGTNNPIVWTSTEEPEKIFLEPGTYILRESNSNGYTPLKDTLFTIDAREKRTVYETLDYSQSKEPTSGTNVNRKLEYRLSSQNNTEKDSDGNPLVNIKDNNLTLEAKNIKDKGRLKIYKQFKDLDGNVQAFPGVTFILKKEGFEQSSTTKMMRDPELGLIAIAEFSNLDPGEYTLSESPIKGIKDLGYGFSVTVNDDGSVVIKAETTSNASHLINNSNSSVTITNEPDATPKGKFKIHKFYKDGDEKKDLSDVRFTLYDENKKEKVTETVSTNSEGELYFWNVPDGTYYLKEEVPEGYKAINDNPWTTIVMSNGKSKVLNADITFSDDSKSITVNKPKNKVTLIDANGDSTNSDSSNKINFADKSNGVYTLKDGDEVISYIKVIDGDIVEVSTSELEYNAFDGHYFDSELSINRKDNNRTTIKPNDGDSLTITNTFDIPSGVKKGDKITFKLSNNIIMDGNPGDIKNPDSYFNNTLANGEYNPADNTITYTFNKISNNVKSAKVENKFKINTDVVNSTKDITVAQFINGENSLRENVRVDYTDYVDKNKAQSKINRYRSAYDVGDPRVFTIETIISPIAGTDNGLTTDYNLHTTFYGNSEKGVDGADVLFLVDASNKTNAVETFNSNFPAIRKTIKDTFPGQNAGRINVIQYDEEGAKSLQGWRNASNNNFTDAMFKVTKSKESANPSYTKLEPVLEKAIKDTLNERLIIVTVTSNTAHLTSLNTDMVDYANASFVYTQADYYNTSRGNVFVKNGFADDYTRVYSSNKNNPWNNFADLKDFITKMPEEGRKPTVKEGTTADITLSDDFEIVSGERYWTLPTLYDGDSMSYDTVVRLKNTSEGKYKVLSNFGLGTGFYNFDSSPEVEIYNKNVRELIDVGPKKISSNYLDGLFNQTVYASSLDESSDTEQGASLELNPSTIVSQNSQQAVGDEKIYASSLKPENVDFDGANVKTYEIENIKQTPGSFKIIKQSETEKDANGKPLALDGVKFTLTGLDGIAKTITETTNASGVIEFKDLPFGEYKLEETKPKDGYKKPNKTWTVKLFNNRDVYIKENPLTEAGSIPAMDDIEVESGAPILEMAPYSVPSSQSAGSEYTISKSEDTTQYGGTEVKTTVNDLGNGEFEIKLELKNTAEKTVDNNAKFNLSFNDNFDFVAGSTVSWNGSENNATTTRWHIGYNPSTKSIDLYDNQPKINKTQTYGIKFKVKAKDNLGAGTYSLINDVIYKHDAKAAEQSIKAPQVIKNGSTTELDYVDTVIPVKDDTANPIEDPTMYAGEEKIVEGSPGTLRTYYNYELINGVRTGKRFFDSEEVIESMVPTRKYVGTMKKEPVSRTDFKDYTKTTDYQVIKTEDPNLAPGEEVVVKEGSRGETITRYTITYKTEGTEAKKPSNWPSDFNPSLNSGEVVTNYSSEVIKDIPAVNKEIRVGSQLDGFTKLTNNTTVIVNTPNKINFQKFSVSNTEDKALDGISFKLKNGNDVIAKVSDENGMVTFEKLKDGSYQLLEEIPDGATVEKGLAIFTRDGKRYSAPANGVVATFTVKDGKFTDVKAWRKTKVDANTEATIGLIPTSLNDSALKAIRIDNETTPTEFTYPSTGGNGVTIAFALIGTTVMLTAIAYYGIYINDKNRRRSNRYKG